MAKTETAILAGGCFWGTQEFDPQTAGRNGHARRLQRRRRSECYIPQSRFARGSDRSGLRAGQGVRRLGVGRLGDRGTSAGMGSGARAAVPRDSRREEAQHDGTLPRGVRAGTEVRLRAVEGRSRANQILRRRIRSPAVSPQRRGHPRVSFQGLGRERLAYCGDDMRLLVESELKPVGGIVGVGFDEFRWPNPARPDDTLHLDIEVLEVRPSQVAPRSRRHQGEDHDAESEQRAGAVSVGNLIVRRRVASTG